VTPAWRALEHTSDVKVEIYGKDLADLFSNAAVCLFDLILDRGRVREKAKLEVKLKSDSLEELFLDWLRELLFTFSTRTIAVSRVEMKHVEENRLEAILFGEGFNERAHGLKVEVKTPTYHEYRIVKTVAGYTATVILDV
jgi:SHS2 domain-containing protein